MGHEPTSRQMPMPNLNMMNTSHSSCYNVALHADAQVLQEAARVVKPTGHILLVQHGKGTWDFMNEYLDTHVDKHYAKWGCRWNKDIMAIIEQVCWDVLIDVELPCRSLGG